MTTLYPPLTDVEASSAEALRRQRAAMTASTGATVTASPLLPVLNNDLARLYASQIVEQGVEGSPQDVRPMSLSTTPTATLAAAVLRLEQASNQLAAIGALDWVATFLPCIVFLDVPGPYEGRYSVSDPDVWGVAALDPRGHPVDWIECLVHEASHQVLAATEFAVPLVRQPVLAPSPFRSGLRSLRRVLAGAHAFVNVATALHELPHSDRQQKILTSALIKAQAALNVLKGHDSLTATGHTWVRDLSSRIRDLTPVPVATPWGWPHTPPAPSAPWSAPASRAGYWRTFAARAEEQPKSPMIESDTAYALGAAIRTAATRQDDWAYHPSLWMFICPHPTPATTDLSALALLAAHVPTLRDHVFHVATDKYCWTPTGPAHIAPGDHLLAALAPSGELPLSPHLDTYSLSVDAVEDEYAGLSPTGSRTPVVTRLARALAQLEVALPACAAWVRHATSVIAPLAPRPGAGLRSGSFAYAPGLIKVDADCSILDILELVVHETAHQHLFLTELDRGPLTTSERPRYWSPLRSCPRPLRGVFLAFHALTFIAALGASLREVGVEDRHLTSFRTSADQALAAYAVLDGARHELSDAGLALLHETEQTLAFATG